MERLEKENQLLRNIEFRLNMRSAQKFYSLYLITFAVLFVCLWVAITARDQQSLPLPPVADTLLISTTLINVPGTSPMPTLPALFTINTINAGYCYNGPSENYQIAAVIPVDSQVNILGKSSDGEDWLLIQGETIGRCWASINVVNDTVNLSNILEVVTAYTILDSVCRLYSNEISPPQTYIPAGWRISINGISDLEASWVLVTPHDSTKQCWVTRSSLTAFNFASVPVVDEFNGLATPPFVPPTLLPPTPTLCWIPENCQ